ncbi:hypothetical protein BV20DRAFT_753213 [Pilatotrama ljubarskyi]|nr:hypothetical protein BV20DRAFT_753213 [Pilatotrama ljubarskyi]
MSTGVATGPIVIGTLVATAMFGWISFQTYYYYFQSWRKDSWWLKFYVFYVWLLKTLHECLLIEWLYRSAIVMFGNPNAWSITTVSDDLITGVVGLIMFSIHLFYMRRLWLLSNGNVFLVGVVGVLAAAHLALEIIVVVFTIRFPEFTEFHRVAPYYTGSLAIAAADDIIIAVSLCYFLYTRRTGIRKTDTLVNRIITYTIMTGALTSVLDIAILVCFVAMPNNLVYLGLFPVLPCLYATSFLAMLNARESLQKITEPTTHGTVLSGLAFAKRVRGGRQVAFGKGAGTGTGTDTLAGLDGTSAFEMDATEDAATSKISFGYSGATGTTMMEDA